MGLFVFVGACFGYFSFCGLIGCAVAAYRGDPSEAETAALIAFWMFFAASISMNLAFLASRLQGERQGEQG